MAPNEAEDKTKVTRREVVLTEAGIKLTAVKSGLASKYRAMPRHLQENIFTMWQQGRMTDPARIEAITQVAQELGWVTITTVAEVPTEEPVPF